MNDFNCFEDCSKQANSIVIDGSAKIDASKTQKSLLLTNDVLIVLMFLIGVYFVRTHIFAFTIWPYFLIHILLQVTFRVFVTFEVQYVMQVFLAFKITAILLLFILDYLLINCLLEVNKQLLLNGLQENRVEGLLLMLETIFFSTIPISFHFTLIYLLIKFMNQISGDKKPRQSIPLQNM